MNRNIFKAFVIFSIGLFFFACKSNAPLQKIQLVGEAQGTYYSILYYDELERNLNVQIDSILDAFDLSVSVYKANSIVSRVNRNEEVVLDEWFINNFNAAIKIAELTDGAMDITIAPLANAWGFGTFDQPDRINPELIDSLRKLVNYQAVTLVNNHLVKEDPRMQLNFNAIAQGNSVDVIGEYFNSLNIESYLIDIGGEVLAKGDKPSGEHWLVGIEKPTETAEEGRELQQTFALKDNALATSGNYRKYYEIDGKRYAHSLDPKSGYPVQHSLLSVSVLAKTCTEADAFATAFMVMGMEKALIFIDQNPDIQAYFIYHDKDNGIETFLSEGFEKALKLD